MSVTDGLSAAWTATPLTHASTPNSACLERLPPNCAVHVLVPLQVAAVELSVDPSASSATKSVGRFGGKITTFLSNTYVIWSRFELSVADTRSGTEVGHCGPVLQFGMMTDSFGLVAAESDGAVAVPASRPARIALTT